MSDLPVFGWKEVATLADWGLTLRAKLDTGAKTSALHVANLTTSADWDQTIAHFDVVLGPKSAPRYHRIDTPILRYQRVRDTGARAEDRPVVATRIVTGPLDVHAEVTLTDRTGMNFRMLLGRQTLAGHVLVDPSRGYVVTDLASLR